MPSNITCKLCNKQRISYSHICPLCAKKLNDTEKKERAKEYFRTHIPEGVAFSIFLSAIIAVPFTMFIPKVFPIWWQNYLVYTVLLTPIILWLDKINTPNLLINFDNEFCTNLQAEQHKQKEEIAKSKQQKAYKSMIKELSKYCLTCKPPIGINEKELVQISIEGYSSRYPSTCIIDVKMIKEQQLESSETYEYSYTEKPDAFSRAMVGGAIAGVTGALVGASSSGEKTHSYSETEYKTRKNYKLAIQLDYSLRPVLLVDFGESMHEALKWESLIKGLMRNRATSD